MEQPYEGRQLSQPIAVSDLLNGRSVATIQPPYCLTEVEFERLKGSPPITATLATIVFSGVIGYAIGLGPKVAPMLEGKSPELAAGEVRTIVVGSVLSLVLYAVGFCWPNSKRKTMKKIASHFEAAPPSTHIIGGAKQ